MTAPRRRLAGRRTATGFGVAAVLAVLGGCATDSADSVIVCARDTPPHVRVEDVFCDRGQPGVGRYAMQLPETEWDYDEETYVYQPILVPNVGAALPIGTGAPSAGFTRARPDTSRPGSYVGFGRGTSVPPKAATAAGSTISRGGLGVSGYGSSGSS